MTRQMSATNDSEYRVEKQQVRATVLLTGGETFDGHFFTASGTAHHGGPERVADLLNAQTFFPFEVYASSRTHLFNRAHVVTVALADNEEQLDPGYEVATPCDVTLRLVTGARLEGTVRIHGPRGRARLSDWTRQPDTFQHIEIGGLTTIVNTSHILEISEVLDE